MNRNASTTAPSSDRPFDVIWREERAYLLRLASRMLADPVEAEDVIQEAFSRLAPVPLDEIDDVRGWLTVVVRRLCLSRLRSAYSRRESSAGAALPDADGTAPSSGDADPADRVTLDDQVQRALAIVLERLTPSERTAFVLHDIFGFPFAAVAEIVGRTPAACRQLASRARRSIRADVEPARRVAPPTESRDLTERFIAACAGGDLAAVMALLDPDVVGEATWLGRGTLVHLEGALRVATSLLGFLGPGSDTLLVPVPVDDHPGLVAITRGRVAAVLRLEHVDGVVVDIHTFVRH